MGRMAAASKVFIPLEEPIQAKLHDARILRADDSPERFCGGL